MVPSSSVDVAPALRGQPTRLSRNYQRRNGGEFWRKAILYVFIFKRRFIIIAKRLYRTATAPGSEVLFPFEVVHLARSRRGSAPTSKGLFSRCVENVSKYECFGRLYSSFFWPFSFRNLTEHLLVIYVNSFWHKTHFIHRISRGQL